MKMHLAGQGGDGARCKNVPNDVCFRMNESLKEIAQQKLERRMNREEETLLDHQALSKNFKSIMRVFQLIVRSSLGKRKASSRITSYFPLAGPRCPTFNQGKVAKS